MRKSLGLSISDNGFENSPTSGLWSVTTLKCGMPCSQNEHFWIAQTIAKHSSSTGAYLDWVGVTEQEPQLIKRIPLSSGSLCMRAKPSPLRQLASVSKSVGNSGSNGFTSSSEVSNFFAF